MAGHGMVLLVAISFWKIWHFKKAFCVQCCGVSVRPATDEGDDGDGGGGDDGDDDGDVGGGEFCLGGVRGCVGIGCVSGVWWLLLEGGNKANSSRYAAATGWYWLWWW